MKSMQSLASACHEIGEKKPNWTQGRGANISQKKGDILAIKASGMRLDEITPTHGIATLSLSRFLSDLETSDSETKYADAIRMSTLGDLRPSMESGFHALLPKTWVAHFHSLAAILMAHEHRTNNYQNDAFIWLDPLMPVL